MVEYTCYSRKTIFNYDVGLFFRLRYTVLFWVYDRCTSTTLKVGLRGLKHMNSSLYVRKTLEYKRRIVCVQVKVSE